MNKDRLRQVNVYIPHNHYEVIRNLSNRIGKSISGTIKELYKETLQIYGLLPTNKENDK